MTSTLSSDTEPSGSLSYWLAQGSVLVGIVGTCGAVNVYAYLKAFNIGIAEVPIRREDLLYAGAKVALAFVVPLLSALFGWGPLYRTCSESWKRALVGAVAALSGMLPWLLVVHNARLSGAEAYYYFAACFLGFIHIFVPLKHTKAAMDFQPAIVFLLALLLVVFSADLGSSQARAAKAGDKVQLLATQPSFMILAQAGLSFPNPTTRLLSEPVVLVYPSTHGEFIYVPDKNGNGKVVCVNHEMFSAIVR